MAGMSALGQKQTFASQNVMSALPPKADMCGAPAHVRFGPKADISYVWPLSPVALDRAVTTVMAFKLGNPTSFRVGLRPSFTNGGESWLGPSSGETSMSHWSQ